MQIINRKERANAKWRFAGLYALSLALVGLLIINGFKMRTVESTEGTEQLKKLKNKQATLIQLSELAAILDRIQELKKPYDSVPSNLQEYDRLREDFKKKLDPLKSIYYSDTVLYRSDLKLVYFMEESHERYREISENLFAKVDDQVTKEREKTARANAGGGGGGGGGDCSAVVEVWKDKFRAEQFRAQKLETQMERYTNAGAKLQDARTTAAEIEQDMDKLLNGLVSIEIENSKIKKKSDQNTAIKSSINSQVQSLKVDVNRIKTTSRSIKILN